MKNYKLTLYILALLFFFCIPLSFAGGPLVITSSGTAAKWDNDFVIPYHPESGSCGSLSNAEILTLIESSLEEYSSLTTVDIQFEAITGMVGNVDESNYGNFLLGTSETPSDTTAILNNGLNVIVFDESADIIADLAGEGNRYGIIGIAAPVGFSTANNEEILKSQFVLNCRCIVGHSNSDCPSSVSVAILANNIVHEMGHFVNLDHTQVNIDLINNGSNVDDDHVPVMFPGIIASPLQKTPQEDDIVAISRLYPSSSFASTYCTVSGTLLDSSGNPLPCADVQASTGDPADTISYVTGSEAVLLDSNGDDDFLDPGECPQSGGCGDFVLTLKPGKNYTISVNPIFSSFVGGSRVGNCTLSQISTIQEEVIGTISASQCTAGSALAFSSSITTSSTGGVESGSSSGGSTSSSGCSLVQDRFVSFSFFHFYFGIFVLISYFMILKLLCPISNKKL